MLLFQTLPGNFLDGIGLRGTVVVVVEGMEFNVDVTLGYERCHDPRVLYVMEDEMWSTALQYSDIEFGDVIVFTKLAKNRLNITVFGFEGGAKIQGQFLGVTQLFFPQNDLDNEDGGRLEIS